MPLTYEVLGAPGRDNALFVKVDAGQSQTRLLFDCGDGCPHQIGPSEVREVDHLCFSHLHMDHVAGFDLFFRANFDRVAKPNRVWVPHGSAGLIGHRFQGFLWNLVGHKQKGEWLVHEIAHDAIRTTRHLAREGFAVAHPGPEQARAGRAILDGGGFTLEAALLDHGTPSVGYLVREHARVNVDTAKLAARGFPPGPWLKRLRGAPAGPGETVDVNGTALPLGDLQRELLVTTPGASIAYLTDFRLTPATADALVPWLTGVDTVVCESQYRGADAGLADAVMHSTADEVAALAARADVGRLVLFHFSDRYDAAGRRELLAEARAIFPRSSFPDGW